MFMYVYVCISMYMYVYVCICMYMYMHVYVYVCIYIYIYIYVCTCMYTCVDMHTFIHTGALGESRYPEDGRKPIYYMAIYFIKFSHMRLKMAKKMALSSSHHSLSSSHHCLSSSHHRWPPHHSTYFIITFHHSFITTCHHSIFVGHLITQSS